VLVAPRDDNPYQELLYREVRKAGVRVRYAEGPSGSQTLNLALSPAMLVLYRLQGFRILHLHWVFQFSLPWARDNRWARRAMQWWFALYLRVASAVGYAVVWTAHDLLPHEPVFADDEQAHRFLLAHADLVIALSGVTCRELSARGARALRTIPFGTYANPDGGEEARQEARRHLGFQPDECVVLHLGKILPYKGADLLLRAAEKVPSDTKLRVLIVGACADSAYGELLQRLGAGCPHRAQLRLERVDDEDMRRYLLAADVGAFPFRAITNSSSVLNAQCFGLPVIIPDLEMLRDIPRESALRYDSTVEGLARALVAFSRLTPGERQDLSVAARRFATATDWRTVAELTVDAYHELLPRR
jgi:glycosyltransferase involved in cell wall biosynthesis